MMKFLLFLVTFAIALADIAEQDGCGRCQLTSRQSIPLAAVDPTKDQVMSYFAFGDFTADDGTVTYSKKGLKLNANPFTMWRGPGAAAELDHPKLVILSNQAYPVPQSGKLVVSGKINVKVFNNKVCQSPYPNCVAQEEDLRFGAAGFTAIDLANSINFGYLVTNDRIFAFYERLPFSRPFLGNYAAFIYVVPVAHRKKEDFNEVAVIFDSVEKTVSFKVEDCLKLTIGNIGARPENRDLLLADLGGDDVSLFPGSIQVLLGTFTTLDFYPACKDLDNCQYPCARMALTTSANEEAYPRYNPLLGAPYACQYFDQEGTTELAHIWGQGVTETIEWIKIKSYDC